MSLLTFFIALAIFVILFAAVPFKLSISYTRVGQDDSASVLLQGFFGLWQHQIDIPFADWRWGIIPHLRLQAITKPSEKSKRPVTEELKPRGFSWWLVHILLTRLAILVRKLMVVRRWFYKGIRCRKFHWEMEVGFKDAALTGMVVGSLWSLVGYYLGKLHKNISFEVPNPEINIQPSFNQAQFNVGFNCIFKLRIAHIIIAGFKVLRIVKLGLKGVRINESSN